MRFRKLEIDDGLPLARRGDALRYAGATRIAPATYRLATPLPGTLTVLPILSPIASHQYH